MSNRWGKSTTPQPYMKNWKQQRNAENERHDSPRKRTALVIPYQMAGPENICVSTLCRLSSIDVYIWICTYVFRNTCVYIICICMNICIHVHVITVNKKKCPWIWKRPRRGMWEGLEGRKEGEMIQSYWLNFPKSKMWFPLPLLLLNLEVIPLIYVLRRGDFELSGIDVECR